MSYQVYIDGCRDSSATAAKQLALAISEKFGVPAADIEARLAKGRFRVKSNLDLAGAKKFVHFLNGVGARCSIVDGQGKLLATAAQETRLGLGSATPPMPSIEPVTPPPELASSNSADPLADMSGLGMRLSALDGSGEFDAGEAPKKAVTDDAAFMPPEMHSELQELEVGESSVGALVAEHTPSVKAAVAEIDELEEYSVPSRRISSSRDVAVVEAEAQMPRSPKKSGASLLAENPNLRFAAGLGIAFLVGMGITLVFAGMRESSVYEPILSALRDEYAAVDSIMAWESLEESKTAAIEALEGKRKRIFITCTLVWAGTSALLLTLWTRFSSQTYSEAH